MSNFSLFREFPRVSLVEKCFIDLTDRVFALDDTYADERSTGSRGTESASAGALSRPRIKTRRSSSRLRDNSINANYRELATNKEGR